MHFESYDIENGDSLESISELNFGYVIQGQHCASPTLLRATLDQETTISDLKLFLESKGGWSNAEFGYLINSSFTPLVTSSDITNHFTEVPGADSSSSGGVSINWSGDYSDYIWLDVDIPIDQIGSTEANYRAIFNYT